MHISAAVTIVAGVGCQALARRVRLPAIVPLLLVGMALGPSGLNVVRPADFGQGLRVVVGFAVAIILFEGGLSLRTEIFKAGGVAIRNLVTIGVLITWALSAWFGHLLFELRWGIAILFGSLVTVTGPTVIIPLLRVVRPSPRLAGVLRGEAIVIDPIGALYAVLVLEYLLVDSKADVALHFGERLLLGTVVGVCAAMLLWFLLRQERTLPPDIKNLTVLAVAIAIYTFSESVLEESGVLSVTLGGLIVGLLHPPGLEEIEKFKGQITLLMVSLVFILLTASVDLGNLAQLGWRGIALVGALVFVVRPTSVMLSTIGSELTIRERLFVSWIAPRGIVAASVSSLFAILLAQSAMAREGDLVRDLTFAVILGTVMIQAPTARFVGRLLGVLEKEHSGYLIVGANRMARGLSKALQAAGLRVVLVDTNGYLIRWARSEGLEAHVANVVDDVAMQEVDLAGIGNLLALTPNDVVNRLSVGLYSQEFGPGHAQTIRVLASPEVGETDRVEGYAFDPLTLEEVIERLRGTGRIEALPLSDEAARPDVRWPLAVIEAGGRVVWACGNSELPTKGTLLALTDPPSPTEQDHAAEG